MDGFHESIRFLGWRNNPSRSNRHHFRITLRIQTQPIAHPHPHPHPQHPRRFRFTCQLEVCNSAYLQLLCFLPPLPPLQPLQPLWPLRLLPLLPILCFRLTFPRCIVSHLDLFSKRNDRSTFYRAPIKPTCSCPRLSLLSKPRTLRVARVPTSFPPLRPLPSHLRFRRRRVLRSIQYNKRNCFTALALLVAREKTRFVVVL